MQINEVLNSKAFYRFTGPPEHWLTAVKFMTWGLTEDLKDQWAKLRSGDVFFIHSTQTGDFKNAKSGIIGIGVVGPNFSIKKNPLWFYETLHKINKWPLLVPLSEIYLFSELPNLDSWDNPSPKNIEKTRSLIDSLLKNYIPLGEVPGFPQMGSFSSVKPEVARKILLDKRPLYFYSSREEGSSSEAVAEAKLEGLNRVDEVKSASEALRYADTLTIVDSVNTRVIRKPLSQYTRNNELLDRANLAHQTILQQLIEIFNSRGYETRSSPFVDLFAHNGNRAFLFEVKSTENKNFRPQARKGIAQLLEYEYFGVNKFATDNNLSFGDKYKLIVPSRVPSDLGYVEFLNQLDIGVALVEKDQLKPVGKDLGFSSI